MSTIHKMGFRDTVPPDEAKVTALARLRAAGHTGEVVSGPRLIQTDQHQANHEFLVAYELADPQ